ncbi:MAG: YigZ family protein [Cyclobacteriaceae bacterium]
MSDHTYKIITTQGEGFYKEKGSKFIAHAYHVADEEAIREKLEWLRKEYYDARHHCYAYILGLQQEISRANDDGEPGHSAGDPILGQIRSYGLTNTLVVVVRYFGGTKLGVSGLITAYKTAAAEALENADIVEKDIVETLELRYPYDSTNQVMRLIADHELTILSQEYLEECLVELAVKIPWINRVKAKLQLLNDTGTVIQSKWQDSQTDE